MQIVNARTGGVVLRDARWCRSAWCRFRGLMLRRDLPEEEGLLFDFGRESVGMTSIHMLFCFFDIAAIWLDSEMHVVDAKLAKPWRPYYASQAPARYLIEARPAVLERVQVGDELSIVA